MSDAGSPPPPPPPPNLTPPPGYEGYTPNLSEALPLRRVGGLRTAILVLLGVYVLGAVVSLAATPAVTDAADEYLDGVIDEDEFLDGWPSTGSPDCSPSAPRSPSSCSRSSGSIASSPTIAPSVAAARGLRAGPSAGGSSRPSSVYAIPMLVLRESWKASDPTVPTGDERWRQSPVNPVVYVWWVLYGLAPIVFIAAGVTFQTGNLSQDSEDLADSLRDSAALTVAQGVVGVAAGGGLGVARPRTDHPAHRTDRRSPAPLRMSPEQREHVPGPPRESR